MFSPIRASITMFFFIVGTLCFIPFQFVWMLFYIGRMPQHQSPVVRLWYRYVLMLIGIKVTVTNKNLISKKHKILLCNHISYLDILVLGAMFDCFFVAKSDVAGWPVFGFLSKLGGTVFVSRQRTQVKKQLDILQNHINAKQSLLIFPEGTTTNGREVLSFKSSLLKAVVTAKKLPVIQPVSLAYTRLNGKKMTAQEEFDVVAWYADMTLVPHLWHVFGQKSLKAKVVIHPVIPVVEHHDTKVLAYESQKIVAEGFHAQFAA